MMQLYKGYFISAGAMPVQPFSPDWYVGGSVYVFGPPPFVLNQAQAQLQSTLAQQRDMERARADQEHALAILCGQAAPLFSIAPNPMHEASPPAVPPGLPAQLLVRRPDVAEAEQNVVAANAEIGVAIANFYPTFTLTNFAGFESANASNLL